MAKKKAKRRRLGAIDRDHLNLAYAAGHTVCDRISSGSEIAHCYDAVDSALGRLARFEGVIDRESTRRMKINGLSIRIPDRVLKRLPKRVRERIRSGIRTRRKAR